MVWMGSRSGCAVGGVAASAWCMGGCCVSDDGASGVVVSVVVSVAESSIGVDSPESPFWEDMASVLARWVVRLLLASCWLN